MSKLIHFEVVGDYHYFRFDGVVEYDEGDIIKPLGNGRVFAVVEVMRTPLFDTVGVGVLAEELEHDE